MTNSEPQQENEIVYVGFWLRFAASIIDTIAITAIILPILLLIYGKGLFTLDVDPDLVQTLQNLTPAFGEFVIKYILPAIAVILFWMFKSATPGKMAINAQIVDAKTFGKPTTRQLIIRYLGYYVSIFPLLIGLLWVAFDRRKQGWHDKLAGTVVIEKRI
ncbi:FIG00349395: hypothetical protein [hydrothermal vent metagenome]|uniref:RDD domain-containing protein n=1 Tax=hydrothermal vent metagenome TaxID=652676 RepID=A0A3B0ZJF4_9ZZZZ